MPTEPLDSPSESKVIYPSCVFGLEKHEIFPYERFAYTALKHGIDALNAVDLPDSLTVTFDGDPAWNLNASVTAVRRPSGSVQGFGVQTSALMPPALFCLCHCVGNDIFDPATAARWTADPSLLRAKLTNLCKCMSDAAHLMRKSGVGYGLRKFWQDTGVTITNFSASVRHFDHLVQFIVNHEVAHAYVRQLTQKRRALTDADRRGFEIVVDLVATEWLYTKIIRYTPDTPEYRKMLGTQTHSESIQDNAWTVVEGQLLLLMFMAIARGMGNSGVISLRAGPRHPEVLLRHVLQDIHFTTLLLSNQQSHVPQNAAQELRELHSSTLRLLGAVGLIPPDAGQFFTEQRRLLDVQSAGLLIDEFDVKVLEKVKPFLQEIKAMQPKD